MSDLAIVYEHPLWFEPLFAALERRGVDFVAMQADSLSFDPAGSPPPARLIFNRIAMSSFLRAADHPLYFAQSLFAHWAGLGARVINGPDAMAVDASKARQLSLMSALGVAVPATRVVHRPEDVPGAAAEIGFPLVVKANVGGSGAGIARFDDKRSLEAAVAEGALPVSVDRVLLVQDYVPARGGSMLRIETLAGRFLYAVRVEGGGVFDLCLADVCQIGSPIKVTHVDPGPELIAAAEAIVAAAGIDIGGVEVMIDDRDGTPRFYDINGLSNFVARPMEVLGWDPHERLVDWLELEIAKASPSSRAEAFA